MATSGAGASAGTPPKVVHLLDYGAGNVRSVRNAIVAAGFRVVDVTSPAELASASVLVFPGVGAFGSAMAFLEKAEFKEPLAAYIRSGKPFMGICLGMQTLFDGSDECPGVTGLGIIPGHVSRFPESDAYSVPHIGWNGVTLHQPHAALASFKPGDKVYFVHSYRATVTAENAEWVATTTDYGDGPFISSVARGNVFATQFHPEKSGSTGLTLFAAALTAFLTAATTLPPTAFALPIVPVSSLSDAARPPTRLAKRIVACLDVRTNDEGDLVVTKGDKYDVREEESGEGGGGARPVRNLGKPVDLCGRYYAEGADEVAFLNITAFRSEPLEDTPMLAVLEAASQRVFVPLTIGGGIRAYTDSTGRAYSALDVAARYFRAGADKVSIGSDAVTAAEEWYARGKVADGTTAIEQIAQVYGRQAVVVSVDPRRVYVSSPAEGTPHHVIPTCVPGPMGERYCWYQCTVKGGREGRPLCAHHLAIAVEALGAGELLVNCVDQDGQKAGYDEELLSSMCAVSHIPIIASSGAGTPAHFASVFQHTRVEAALAAGIFHRKEVAIADVKAHLAGVGIEQRGAVITTAGS